MARVVLIDNRVNREAVRLVKDLLRQIEDGTINAIAFAAVSGPNEVKVGWAEGRNTQMLATSIRHLTSEFLNGKDGDHDKRR